jgi:hypothetical protein
MKKRRDDGTAVPRTGYKSPGMEAESTEVDKLKLVRWL